MNYTTTGSIRGCCGHTHRSEETATKCLERDRRGCASQGGYSDRRVVPILHGEKQSDAVDRSLRQ